MKLFRAPWDDGTVSVVLAKDKDEVIKKLENYGDVDESSIVEVSDFVATFGFTEADEEEREDDADLEGGVWDVTFDENTEVELGKAIVEAADEAS